MMPPKKTLLILDSDVSPSRLYRRLDAALVTISFQTPLDYLGFVEDPQELLFTRIKTLFGPSVATLDAARLLNQDADAVGKEIVALVERVRDAVLGSKMRFPFAGKEDLFARLFWYSDISEKNTLGQPVWWALYRFAGIEKILQSGVYSSVYYVGNSATARMVSALCRKLRLSFHTDLRETPRFLISKLVIKRIFAMRSMLCAVTEATKQFPVDLSKAFSIGHSLIKRKILAFTLFPKSWTRREGEEQDRYFGTLDEAIAASGESVMHYALIPYDGGDYVKPAVYKKRLGQIASFPRKAVCFVLDSFGDKREVLKAYLRFAPILAGICLTRTKSFQDAFLFRNVSAWKVLAGLWWRGIFLSFPYLEVLEKQTSRLVRYVAPDALIYYKFEYTFGRAIASAANHHAREAIHVGMQHGPITPAKLMYSGSVADFNFGHGRSMPQPSLYAVDGPGAKKILAESGILHETICVTGPVRFDAVWPRAKMAAKRPRFQDPLVSVCVATGLHDFEFIASFVLDALGKDSRLHLKLKPHPKIARHYVDRILKTVLPKENNPSARVEVIYEAEIYQTMEESDLFIATYSSTGVEAIVFGLPVVLLHSRRMPDASLFACGDYGILSVARADELREYVNQIIMNAAWREEYLEHLQSAVYDSFYEQDSQAGERLAKLLNKGLRDKGSELKRSPEPFALSSGIYDSK